MTTLRALRGSVAALCCAVSLCAAAAPAKYDKIKDPLEPARAALRTLQFNKAIELLNAAGNAGNADAQYLLGLMYLNGVGVASDPKHARALLQSAGEHGQGEAAYVLAAELAQQKDAPAGAAHQWLERSAKLGYFRAVDALKSGRPLLDREYAGATDPSLLAAWVIDSVRKNDAAEIRRLGKASVAVRDEFGRTALSYAAEAGSVAAATALLDLGADIAAADKAGTTALMIAAERPDAAMVDLLLQHGADPQAADAEKRNALFYAARGNQPGNVRALQHAGVSLDARDGRDYNALDAAIAVDADAAATELRELGVHVHLVTLERRSGKFDPAHAGEIYRGWPPLALAVSRNDTATVQQLLAAGGDANLRLPQRDPLLQIAADAHALESLSLLLAHGANPLATDHSGHSALWLAAARNDLELVTALLKAGVKQTPLLAALRATHSEVAQALLAAGASPDVVDAQGHTPLMLASAGGQIALVRTLLALHARTDTADPGGRTALWYAASSGSRDTVVALIGAGASADAVDATGLTALHAAAAQADATVLEPLLASASSLNKRSAGGDTALLIASAKGRTEVVKALLAQKPALDAQNSAGDTALIAASRGGYTAICHMLLAAGANKGLRNSASVSAADIAAGRGFAAIAKEIAGNG
jgi:ankyrin repeat protein